MTAETQALTSELHNANAKLDEVLVRFDDLSERHAQERRWSMRHRVASAVLALVVIAVIVLSVRDAQQRNDAEQRDCLTANAARADIRAAIVDSALVIVERTESPEQLSPLVAEIQDRLAVTIPDRIC